MNRDGGTAYLVCVEMGDCHPGQPRRSVGPDIIGARGPSGGKTGYRTRKDNTTAKATEKAPDSPDIIGGTGPQV